MSRPSQEGTVATQCYFDMTIDDEPAGRIVLGLFMETPRTSGNFKELCDGTEINGRPAGYAGSIFHRCIKAFMLQGGDFERFDGTGGFCIYGAKFADENFEFKHDRPFLLSMANAGPNTNGSQFFITTVPTPWLDGKHVQHQTWLHNSGKVMDQDSMDVVRKIENLKTRAGDKPIKTVKVAASGTL